MIDSATITKVIDTADIVDVVSDFVALRKRGANYVGLCPFHNDRNPSFYVSRTKGYCKCFSCGEGGSAVSFLRKKENMTFIEAIRYLAKKYNIEIEEKELSPEELQLQSERESLLNINEFALKFFEDQLHNTDEGRMVGLSYFTERGMTMESIKHFRLGYSPANRDALYQAATKAGFNRDHLFRLGLCYDDHHGNGFDAYRDRVIFPIFNVAGKVIGFGGRTLKNDVRKYINSPENPIYDKSKALYGLLQAKNAIGKQDKCFIVEGYFDVISMHQSGFTNVIATSGTALTPNHVYAIKRFTENVTELFDGDSAGIHAAEKGLDRLLKLGMKVKVLILPEPEDPDSFAKSHSASEIAAYIEQHETDGIRFLINSKLQGTENDPLRRATAIEEVLKTVAVIPSNILRDIYVQECSNFFGIEMKKVQNRVERNRIIMLEEDRKAQEAENRRKQAIGEKATAENNAPNQPSGTPVAQKEATTQPATTPQAFNPYEEEVIRYVAKYGATHFCDTEINNEMVPTTLCEWVTTQLRADAMKFSAPIFEQILDLCNQYVAQFHQDFPAFLEQINRKREQMRAEGIAQIRQQEIGSISDIETKEKELENRIELALNNEIVDFRKNYVEKRLLSHPDQNVCNVALELVAEKHFLSKIHTEQHAVVTDYDRLFSIVPAVLCSWKLQLVKQHITVINDRISAATTPEEITELMKTLQQMLYTQKELSKLTGERVISPSR